MKWIIFDVEVVVDDAVHSLECEMAEIEDVYLIICCLLVEPNFEGTDLRAKPELLDESFVVRYFLCHFADEALHLTPNELFQLFVYLLTEFHCLRLHILINLQLVAVVED